MSRGVYLTPSKYVILLFGGVRPLARLIGVKANTVSCWQTRRDGAIPSVNYKPILEAAKKRGIELTAEDLVFGKTLFKNEIATKRTENRIDRRIKT